MNDNQKTKAQLLDELADLRRQVHRLETKNKPRQDIEENYRAILDNIEDGYYEVDLSGKYIFVNPSVCKYHGRSPDQLIGRSYREFISTPESAQEIYEIFNKIYRTGIPADTFDYQIIGKDGEIRDLEMSASLIRDANGKPSGFRGISRDVSERKKMEVEQERYRNYFENITEGCFEVDLRGNIIFANEAISRMYGYTREEYLGMNYRDLETSGAAGKLFPIFNEIFRTGQPSPLIEVEIIRKDGTVVTVETKASLIRDSKGKPSGFRGVSRDITKRKKLEAEQERYRDFVENISDWCFEVDLNGKFTFVNEAICRRFGYPRESLIGTDNLSFSIPEEGKIIREVFNEVYQTGLPSKVFEYKHTRRNGEIGYVQMAVSLIGDYTGKPIGFRGVSRDITELKSLETEKERSWSFIENITDGCFEVDLAGNITFFNEAACQMFGYPREEFLGMNNRAYTSPETAKNTFKIFNEIYRTGSPANLFDYEVIHKDGTISILEMSASLIQDKSGTPIGFRGISRDITERKKMETEQERFRDFVENVTDGVWENDLAGNMTFVNEASCRMFGYTREEFMGINNRAYTTPETAKRIFKMFNKIYRTGSPAEIFDYEIIHKNGEIRSLEMSASLIRDSNGKPIGFRGISRDITERKKMEAENERYRDFVENINDGCWETDLRGNTTFANKVSVQRLGYPSEEFIGMNNRAYTNPETAKKIFNIFSEILRTGRPSGIFENEVIRRDGTINILEMSASLIQDANGKPIGFRGVSRDITERKKMEAETVRLTELLTQSRKLEAVGTLAGGIAHDFNNILMGIQGYASLMLLDIDTTHPFYEKLKAIEDQIKSAADLTGQLLGYARGGRYEVKTTSLNELIGKTASMFGRTKKEIRIHQTFAKDLWTVEADRGQLEQVLLNLFMNAWQAMPGGGALYLQTENVILDEFYVEPFGTAPGPFVKISVTDTGVGMDRETKDRVFEPFFTTKEMGRGTGLGLASAYGIIRGHGGIINVYSEKGYGTTFNFYLPASQKEVIEEMRPAREIIKGNETLLLVDDEKIITDVTAAMITRLGYQILIAHNGEEAVEIYQANPNRVDLVILDMIMPGIGGGKAFDLIQSINPQAKIILSSGFSLNGEAKEIMNRGARAFLQKPFQIDDLSKVIREVLEAV